MPLDLDTLDKAARFLRAGDHYLLTTHIRPDGDALGSVVALGRWLRRIGKRTTTLILTEPAAKYVPCLAGEQVLILSGDGRPPADCYQADKMVIVDTSSVGQLEGLGPLLDSPPGPVMVIDHHATAEPLGQVRVIDPTAAAAGILVAEIIDHMGGPLDVALAEPLFLAIGTDTGWFRFSNTDARTCRWAARLLETGIQPDVLYRSVYQTDQPSRLRLLGEVLSTVEFHADNRIAVGIVTQEMFRRHGVNPADTENLIDEPQRVGSVIAVAMLIELPDGRVRVGLRSKHTVDVSAIAGELGGGGHVRAAGTYTEGPLPRAKQKVLAKLAAALRQSEG